MLHCLLFWHVHFLILLYKVVTNVCLHLFGISCYASIGALLLFILSMTAFACLFKVGQKP